MSFKRLLKAARLGNPQAQYNLAALIATGESGFEKNQKVAARWYRKAARQGHAEAQFNLGIMYLLGEGVSLCPMTGWSWLRKSIRNGYWYTAKVLAELYEGGYCGLPKNEIKAKYWVDFYRLRNRSPNG